LTKGLGERKESEEMRVKAIRTFLILAVVVVFAISCGGGNGAAGGGAASVDCSEVDLSKSPDKPVKIHLGHGFAAEEQVWLMKAKPDLTKYQGKWYTLELTPFAEHSERYNAAQTGDLQALTTSGPAIIRAVAQGVPVQAVVTVTREAPEGIGTYGVALADSGITKPKDLKGTTIAITEIGSATDYWAKTAVASAGYDFEKDAEYVVLPFPSMEDALRNGQVDVAVLPEPFYTIAHQNGGVVDVFNSLTGPGFAQELILVAFTESFIQENPEAVCAWVEDFQSATKWYNNNVEQARKAVFEAGFVEGSLDTYLQSGDWVHPEGGVVDVKGLGRLNESMIEFELLEENQRADPEEIIAKGITPTKSKDK
jgi:ABC-type nitrate/sulfonate/bicarbonate transport system substrate-binding protein